MFLTCEPHIVRFTDMIQFIRYTLMYRTIQGHLWYKTFCTRYDTNNLLMPNFVNPYPKAHEEESPMKSKAHQEDRRARKVQKKKCKGKQSITKRKSTAEYRSTVEYSSSAEWLWQIKANWAQDPFDPINIIWPTKAQILSYKKIGVKTNMKKHDEKKKGIAGSVSSRNHVKERKSQTKGKWQT